MRHDGPRLSGGGRIKDNEGGGRGVLGTSPKGKFFFNFNII